jgi:hypothetical protein
MEILDRLLRKGSAVAYVDGKKNEWRDKRNQHECERIAFAIDEFLTTGVGYRNPGMSALLRNLAAVELADSSGNWNVVSSIAGPQEGLLSRTELRKVLRETANYEKCFKKVSPGGGKKV